MKKLQELLRFNGRLSRLGFWRGYLRLGIIGALAWALALFAIMAVGKLAGALLILVLPIMVASIAILVRRLHDRDKSGWWVALYVAFPLLVGLWAQNEGSKSSTGVVVILVLAGFVLNIWGLVDIGFRRGTRGPNRFGEEPVVGA